MSSQPQSQESEARFTRREGKNESICMHCYQTLRGPDARTLSLMERAHVLDCPQRPWH
jgi:hypothetical protein